MMDFGISGITNFVTRVNSIVLKSIQNYFNYKLCNCRLLLKSVAYYSPFIFSKQNGSSMKLKLNTTAQMLIYEHVNKLCIKTKF